MLPLDLLSGGPINLASDVPYNSPMVFPQPPLLRVHPYSSLNLDDWISRIPFTNNTVEMPITFTNDGYESHMTLSVKISLERHSAGGPDCILNQGQSTPFRMHPPFIPRMNYTEVAFSGLIGRAGSPSQSVFAIGRLSRLVEQYRSAAIVKQVDTHDGDILIGASVNDLESFCLPDSRLMFRLEDGTFGRGSIRASDGYFLAEQVDVFLGENPIGKKFSFPRHLADRISELMFRHNQGMAIMDARDGYTESIHTHCDRLIMNYLQTVDVHFGSSGYFRLYPEDYMLHDAESNECTEDFIRSGDNTAISVDFLKFKNLNILITRTAIHLCDPRPN